MTKLKLKKQEVLTRARTQITSCYRSAILFPSFVHGSAEHQVEQNPTSMVHLVELSEETQINSGDSCAIFLSMEENKTLLGNIAKIVLIYKTS